MTDSIVFNQDWMTAEIARGVPTTYGHFDVSIGRVVDDVLVGGVLFKDFTQESIRISVASFRPRWLSHEFLFVVFGYPFHQLGVARLFGNVPAKNTVAREFNRRLGFREIAEIPGIYPGPSAVVVTCMERAECRWLKLRSRRLEAHE